MLVYRIESESKEGPYQSGYPGKEAQRVQDKWWSIHPPPNEDGELRNVKILESHYFGFLNMEKLKDWWPEHNWKIFAQWNKDNPEEPPLGLGVYAVSPLHVETGEKQLVFLMHESERIRFEPFCTVDNISKKIIITIAG